MSNVTKKESIATCLTLFLAAAVQIIIIKVLALKTKQYNVFRHDLNVCLFVFLIWQHIFF